MCGFKLPVNVKIFLVYLMIHFRFMLSCCFQISLPTQTFQTHWLTFSPVEEHFYRQQYYVCAREAMIVTILFISCTSVCCLFCCKV